MKAIKSLLLISFIAQINIQAQPVRPGDFNMDGVVNVSDALYWGLAHGEAGPARLNATTDWTPQVADDWDESINTVNNKYQDADGNGLIDTFDLEALHLNYDLTHTNTIKGNIEAKKHFWMSYYYEIDNGIKTHKYNVNMKQDTLHGIAFTFDYSSFGDAAIDVSLDTTGLWLQVGDVVVEVLQEDDYKLHVALTRTSGGNLKMIDETLAKIVICEPIASLNDSPEIYVTNGELMRANEKRYEIENHTFETPPLAKPECIELWNGEQCEYRNGLINHKEALLNQYGDGFCFEGQLYGDDIAGISMGCGDDLSEINPCYLDTLRFYAKSDIDGIGKSFEFYISDTDGNVGYIISVNNLDTTYQHIEVPINTLSDKACALEGVEWISFRKTQGASDFRIYIEDINAGWARMWKPDLCYYREGTLNQEEAHNGRYCYERVVDEDDEDGWYHSVISLWCGEAPYDLSLSDEIRFYAKADKEEKSFNVHLSENISGVGWSDCDANINVNDYIEGGNLTTNYQLVRIPIDSLTTVACGLKRVDGIHFFNRDDINFKFYIDDIHVYSDTIGCPTIVNTTFPETPDEPVLTLYPNPVSQSILNIEINNLQTSIAEMLITDLQGHTLHWSRVPLVGENTLNYNTDNLPTGMYIIQIKDKDGQTATSKFIKMK